MGFMSGVVTGVALAAGAAAWYLSRSGERFREQYRVDRKLGEFGDLLESRTRDIQASVNTQIADSRDRSPEAVVGTEPRLDDLGARLDDTQASAAEAAAKVAADVEAKAVKIRKQAKAATSD